MARPSDHVILQEKISNFKPNEPASSCKIWDGHYSVVDVQTANGRIAAQQIAKMVTFAVLVSPQFDFLVSASCGKVVATFVVFDGVNFSIMTFERVPRAAEPRQNVALSLS